MKRLLEKGLSRLLSGRRGFTIIEVVAALGIAVAVVPIAAATLHQALSFTSRSSENLRTVADLRYSIKWLAEDLPMASTISLVAEFPTVYDSLTLDWIDEFGGTSTPHSASYSLVGTELRRTNENAKMIVVARRVSFVEFSRVGKLVTVTVISTDNALPDVTKQYSHYFYLRSLI